MPEDLQLTIIASTLPEDFCPTSEQDRLETYSENQYALLPGNLARIVVSFDMPALEDEDKIWYRLDSEGKLDGRFINVAGDWYSEKNPNPPGTIVMDCTDYGNEAAAKAAILLLDYGTEDEPFWRLCDGTEDTPDMRGRAPIGAGTGTSLTARALGDAVGEETNTLTTAKIPAHSHTGSTASAGAHTHEVKSLNFTTDSVSLWGKTIGGAGTAYYYGAQGAVNGYWPQLNTESNGAHTHTVTVGDTGGGEAHNNMQPSKAVWFRMRTSKERFVL